MVNQKYFIDYCNERRQCMNCFAIKPFRDFSQTPTGTPKSKCKKCHSEIENYRYRVNQMEKYPQKYKECDVCDDIYIIKKGCKRCKEELVENKGLTVQA